LDTSFIREQRLNVALSDPNLISAHKKDIGDERRRGRKKRKKRETMTEK
jgi:hypothetical protein